LPIYGTTLYPGIAMLSTYNLTSTANVTCQANGSVIEVFAAICEED
jgi:hypothetical protein